MTLPQNQRKIRLFGYVAFHIQGGGFFKSIIREKDVLHTFFAQYR